MNTTQNVYNIIWVDDEVDTLYAASKGMFRCEGINVIATPHTSLEFKEIMDVCYDRVDAVITDANFNNGKKNIDIEKDLSGFVDMPTFIERYNSKRSIPFYLYTGRFNLLEENQIVDIEYFEKHDSIFHKGELEDLLQRIKADVDRIHSPSYRVRQKYEKELEAANAIEGNQEYLMDALLKEENGDLTDVGKEFNAIRQLVERIVAHCKTLNILPNISELNKVPNFLLNRECDYKLNENVEIMPKPLIRSLRYLLDITQDASHDGSSTLNLGVEAFVRETHNINVFRSVLFIAMDLCLWYKEYSDKHPDADLNALDWEVREEKYYFEGEVVESKGHFFCGNYELQKPRNNEYHVGDTVCIKGYDDHNRPDDYQLGARLVHIDKFVYLSFITVKKQKRNK